MACEKQTFCSGRRMIKQILKRVSDSIYKPKVNKEIQQALESREGHGLIDINSPASSFIRVYQKKNYGL